MKRSLLLFGCIFNLLITACVGQLANVTRTADGLIVLSNGAVRANAFSGTNYTLGGISINSWLDVGSTFNWSQYVATQTVDLANNNITNVGNITAASYKLNGITISSWPSASSNWSQSAATQTVNFANNNITNVNNIKSTSYTLGDNIITSWLDIGNIFNWSQYVATQTVDLANNNVTNVGNITATSYTLDGITVTTWPEGGTNFNWSLYGAQQDVEMSNNAIINVSTIYDSNNNGVIGFEAMLRSSNCDHNGVSGYQAMMDSTNCDHNGVSGSSSMQNAQGCINNSTSGRYAMFNAYNCDYNNASGYRAMYGADICSCNGAIGYQVMYNAYACSYNGVIGYNAMGRATNCDYNGVSGFEALQYATNCDHNGAIGCFSMKSGQECNYNGVIGNVSMAYANNCSYNGAVGNYVLFGANNCWANGSIGNSAMRWATNSSYNGAVGNYSMYMANNASNSFAGGSYAGRNATGSGKVYIDSYTDDPGASYNPTNDAIFIDNGSVNIGRGNITNILRGRWKLNGSGIYTVQGSLEYVNLYTGSITHIFFDSPTNMYLCSQVGDTAYRSIDTGLTWTATSFVPATRMRVKNNYLWGASPLNFIIFSTNYGSTYTTFLGDFILDEPEMTDQYWKGLAVTSNGTVAYILSQEYVWCVELLPDATNKYYYSSVPSANCSALAVWNDIAFASSSTGNIWRSTDISSRSSCSWTVVLNSTNNFNNIYTYDGTNYYASYTNGTDSGIYRSFNSGNTWIDCGLVPNTSYTELTSLSSDSLYMLSGTNVYKYSSINEIIPEDYVNIPKLITPISVNNIDFSTLPTNDPGIFGRLWQSGSNLYISAGQ